MSSLKFDIFIHDERKNLHVLKHLTIMLLDYTMTISQENHNLGVFVIRGFLNTLIPVFYNSYFLVFYSLIHYKDFYFSEFLVLKYLKNPVTQTLMIIYLQ